MILRGKYGYAYSWGRPKWNIISYFRGDSMTFHLYRLEDIPYSGVICNIISYFFSSLRVFPT